MTPLPRVMAEAVTRPFGGSAAWYGRQSLPVGIPRQSLGTRAPLLPLFPVPYSLFPVPFSCLFPSLPLPMSREMTNLSIAIEGEGILSGFEAVETEFYAIEIEAI